MNSSDKQVQRLLRFFEEYNPFINSQNEIILVPQFNVYFRLDNIETETELKCKVLEWLSRDAYKTQFYHQDWRNKIVHDNIRSKINGFLGTNFSHDDMQLIYTKLGNSCNRELTVKFVEFNYDMSLLGVA